jgi:VWFA-related protein
MSTRCVRWFPLFGLSLFSGLAQQAQPPGPITLDVVVTDKSGKPVPGLQQQDFTLLDNKQPQKILSFQAVQGGAAAADPPVQVLLLVDEVNTNFIHGSSERGQIEKFLKRDGGELPRPVSLAVLTDSGMAMGNLSTRDGNALATELDQNKAGLRTITPSQGFYGADDRVGLSLRALQQLADYETPRPGRKLVIWISPGWPLLSGPHVELSSKDQEKLFATIVGLSDSLRRARIILDSIDPLGTQDAGGFRTTYYEQFVKGVKKAGQVQIANLSLQVLATQSGGRVLISDNDVAGEIAKCIADANAFYVLTFEGLAGDSENEYHSLEMKVDKPGLKALTRTGYYAQPIAR